MSSRPASSIREAVILMAGLGSRLRVHGQSQVPKPLTPILGRPLISYNLEGLQLAGIETVYAIVGFEEELVVDGIKPLIPRGLEIRFIHNSEWRKQNGVSVLAAAGAVHGPFLLIMSDHLYEQNIFDQLARTSSKNEIALAVDRKIASIFDLDDAMKVVTVGDRVVRLEKNLEQYDAIDTGLFACSPRIFHYLELAKHEGDCSLAEGVQFAANDSQVRAVDIGDAWWQDIDTPEMLGAAEDYLRHGSAPAPAHVPGGNRGKKKVDARHSRPEMKDVLR
jgi:1L-myo-inositol 1-phosphate cytidylyltransferase